MNHLILNIYKWRYIDFTKLASGRRDTEIKRKGEKYKCTALEISLKVITTMVAIYKHLLQQESNNYFLLLLIFQFCHKEKQILSVFHVKNGSRNAS